MMCFVFVKFKICEKIKYILGYFFCCRFNIKVVFILLIFKCNIYILECNSNVNVYVNLCNNVERFKLFCIMMVVFFMDGILY